MDETRRTVKASEPVIPDGCYAARANDVDQGPTHIKLTFEFGVQVRTWDRLSWRDDKKYYDSYVSRSLSYTIPNDLSSPLTNQVVRALINDFDNVPIVEVNLKYLEFANAEIEVKGGRIIHIYPAKNS
jgi:hypothetical protein